MKDVYETLEHEKVTLSHLRPDEKAFLADLFKRLEEGSSYLSFKRVYLAPDSPVFSCAKRLGKDPEETPLYKVCEDLSKQLGIGQGYLVRAEVVGYEAGPKPQDRELTTGEVASLSGCTAQAVRNAISTWRLLARRVGRLSLVTEKDARAFAQAVRRYRGSPREVASVVADPARAKTFNAALGRVMSKHDKTFAKLAK